MAKLRPNFSRASEPRNKLAARLGTRFEAYALNVGERIDVRGIEPRLGPQHPVTIEVPPSGYAVLMRAGIVVLFGVDPIDQERFLASLEPRISQPHVHIETERAIIQVGDADTVETDTMIVRELTIERLQLIAEVLGKSVVLARYEPQIAEVFTAIEPIAAQMTAARRSLPWRQGDLVKHIGGAMLVEHHLVGRAELLEKPDLLWDHPELGRFYTRLETEYDLRDRHLALDTKLGVVSRSAQAMLDLANSKRSMHLEYYVAALIAFEAALAVLELTSH